MLVILAPPVGLIIRQLDQHADTVRKADHLVRSIELDAANIRALEWKARALKGPTPGLFAEARASEAVLVKDVDALERNGASPNVARPAGVYETAYVQLLASARTATSGDLSRDYFTTVVPAERRLARAFVTETVAIERSSEQAQNRAMVGTIVGLVALGGLVLLLALRVNRFRAAQLETAADGERKLRRAERLYRTLVERLPGLTYISALDGSGSDFVSPQLETILGYRPDEWHEDPGLFRKLIHPDDRARVLREGLIFRQGTGSQVFEYRMVARDGRVIWAQDDAVIVSDDHGRPEHVQGYLRDVTLLKLARDQHDALLAQERAANERLRELDAMKDEFVALVSHELRTPLTSIIGYVELVLDQESGDLSKEQKQYLHVIARNSRRLQRLVGDLLFIARYHAGKFEIERASIDLSAIARECVDAALPTAQAAGVELICFADEQITMNGDQMRIGQLLDNLVSNALKFTRRDGRVELRATEEHGRIVIEVADTGIGIAKDAQAHLFEKFFRTSEATKKAIQGTGLGLAISQAIAEAHGGSIIVESEEGVGTTFHVTLPQNGVQLSQAA
jgi:PAS domain S-box-containing protein